MGTGAVSTADDAVLPEAAAAGGDADGCDPILLFCIRPAPSPSVGGGGFMIDDMTLCYCEFAPIRCVAAPAIKQQRMEQSTYMYS